jgi:hypothetical protein
LAARLSAETKRFTATASEQADRLAVDRRMRYDCHAAPFLKNIAMRPPRSCAVEARVAGVEDSPEGSWRGVSFALQATVVRRRVKAAC